MRKLLFLLLVSASAFSQKEIVNLKLTDQLPGIGFDYSYADDKLVIENAYKVTAMATYFNKVTTYNENAQATTIIPDDDFVVFWVGKNSAMRTMDAGANCKYYSGGQSYMRKGSRSSYFMTFDASNEYDIGDKKGKSIDFEKDLLFLTKYNYKTKESAVIPLEKPAMERYRKGVSGPKKIGAFMELTNDGQIDVITKTIGPDEKNLTKATMYRTIYDQNGKLLHDYAYSYSIADGNLGQIYYKNPKPFTDVSYTWSLEPNHGPIVDLDSNKHFFDPKTRDIYIYGVYFQDDKAMGIYLIKFKENGEKLWQKTYSIGDQKITKKTAFVNMDAEVGLGNIYLRLSGEYSASKKFNLFYKISKQDGTLAQTASQDSEKSTAKGTFTAKGGKGTMFFTESAEKNKFTDGTTFMAMAFNEKLKNYVQKVPAKKDVFFDTYFTDKGLWLMEGDNKTYFKVNLFEY